MSPRDTPPDELGDGADRDGRQGELFVDGAPAYCRNPKCPHIARGNGYCSSRCQLIVEGGRR